VSNYCVGCGSAPASSVGSDAWPFTTLYWDFLMRHEKSLRANRRMGFQVRNAGRLAHGDKAAIHRQAGALRDGLAAEARSCAR